MKVLMDNKKWVGCHIAENNDVHIGNMVTRKTACGRELVATLIFEEEVDVNCQVCLDNQQKKKGMGNPKIKNSKKSK